MAQLITLIVTNEVIDNLQRLRAKWPKWDDEQLLRKALAMAAQQVKAEAPEETESLSPFQKDVEDLWGKQDW